MKKIYTIIALSLFTLLPVITFAQSTTGKKDLKYIVGIVIEYLNIGLMLIISLATVVFVWNVYRYFFTEAGGEGKKEAGMYVLWSVVGFFVILSFWGLVALLRTSLPLDDQRPNIVPIGLDFNRTNTGPQGNPG